MDGMRQLLDTNVVEVSVENVSYGLACWSSPFDAMATPGRYGCCYLVRKGCAVIELDDPRDCSVSLPEKAIVSISAMVPHRIRNCGRRGQKTGSLSDSILSIGDVPQGCTGDVEIIVGNSHSSKLAEIGAFAGLLVITPTNEPTVHKRIWDTWEMIQDELSEPRIGTDAIVSLLSEIILRNVVRFASQNPETGISMLNASHDERVLRALTAIGADPCRDWTVADLADIAHMSRTSFALAFHNILGITPMQAVRSSRFSKARYLLATTNMPLESISEVCGYSSSASFIRGFEKSFGYTPAKWRKKHYETSVHE